MKPRKKNNVNKFFNLTGILFFGVFIFLVVGNVFHKDKTFSETENRMLAERPELSVDGLLSGRFESDYETYINDQFVFREAWVYLKGLADTVSGKQESNGVFRGSDGYLIENFVSPDAENVEKIQKALGAFKEKFPDLKQYFLLAPTAVNIMEKNLPVGAPVADQDLWMDQVYDSVTENGFVPIDIRDHFAECRDNKVQTLFTEQITTGRQEGPMRPLPRLFLLWRSQNRFQNTEG